MTDFKLLERKVNELEERVKKLLIDYERAARLLEDLRAEGVI